MYLRVIMFSDGCHRVSNNEVLSASQLIDVFLVICAMIVRCVMMNSLLQAKRTIFLSVIILAVGNSCEALI